MKQEFKVLDIYWKEDGHKDRVIELLKKYNRIYKANEIDLEYFPAFYIIAQGELKRKCLKYVTDDGIDWTTMKEEKIFSSSENHLVDLANHLYNYSDSKPQIIDLIGSLDEENWKLAMNAIELRRHSHYYNEVTGDIYDKIWIKF